MYCIKCGAQTAEDALFCAKCGAPLQGQEKPVSTEPEREPMQPDQDPESLDPYALEPLPQGKAASGDAGVAKKNKHSKAGIIAAIAAAVVVITLVACAVGGLFDGRSYEEAIDQYINAAYTADIKAYVDTLPREVVDEMMEQYGYDRDEWDEFLQDGQDMLERAIEKINENLGGKWRFSYEISGIYAMDWRSFREAQAAYREIGLDVSEGKRITFETVLRGKQEQKENEGTMYVLKIGNCWYVHADAARDNFGIPWKTRE